MPYWTNQADTKQVRFQDSLWKIGYMTDAGTWTTSFKSKKNALPCPESDYKVNQWKMKSGEDWIDTGSDIKVMMNPGKNL